MPIRVRDSGLVWDDELRYGYYPAKPDGKYDEAYWRKYQSYDGTEMGRKLTDFRVALVDRHCPGEPVLDFGIGSGFFVRSRSNTKGYDVNPFGVKWLREKGLWLDPYDRGADHVTCWDSLEHIQYPEGLLRKVRKTLFVSIPIFCGPEHVERSKHFKRDEHFQYFTEAGLVAWAEGLGFGLVEASGAETAMGREDILTFVFKRGRVR